MIIVIDDLREFRWDVAATTHEEIVYLKTEAAAIIHLMDLHYDETEITQLWLDHDLGLLPSGEPSTTMSLVTIFCEAAIELELPLNVGEILVHTANPVANKRMVDDLSAAGYNVRSVDPTDYFECGNVES